MARRIRPEPRPPAGLVSSELPPERVYAAMRQGAPPQLAQHAHEIMEDTPLAAERSSDNTWFMELDPGSVGLMRWLYQNKLVSSGTTADGVPFMVVADSSNQLTETPAQTRRAEATLQEIGSSSPSPYTSWLRRETLTALAGHQGLQTYLKMKRSDPAIRGSLRYLKTPIESAKWFVQPADNTTVAKRQAEFVERNLFHKMNVPWGTFLRDALLCVDYGYIAFVPVYKIEDNKAWLRKLAPRHPLDIELFLYDEHGGPNGITLFPPAGANTVSADTGVSLDPGTAMGRDRTGLTIGIEDLVIFTLDGEAGDMMGTSALRAAYKPWFYRDTLMKIDAIQKERHGIGVPIIKLPPTFDDADRRLAEEMGRNLRTNDRAHIVLPHGWELEFAELQGQPVDVMKSIEFYTEEIYRQILAPGSNGKDQDYDMFLKATRYIAATIAEGMNRFLVPKLVDYNWSNTDDYPKLTARWIGEFDDMRTRSFAIRNLVGAGVIRPDDQMEDQLREELDLPQRDPDTDRMANFPENAPPGGLDPDAYPGQQPGPRGATAGMPRQAPPRAALPKGNAGTDRTGGTR